MKKNESISIKWFLSFDEIEKSSLPEHLKPEASRSILINDVSMEILITKLQRGNPEIIKSKDLFHPRMNRNKTGQIVDAWKRNIPLLPPTIFFIPQMKRLEIEDGRHRLNIAYYFEAEKIPIIVPINDYPQIFHLLNS